MSNLVRPDKLAKYLPSTQGSTVYCIARNRQEIMALADNLNLPRENFRWLHRPEELDGLSSPVVVIFPNWWQRDYSGMEQALIDSDAEVYIIHHGLKPRFR